MSSRETASLSDPALARDGPGNDAHPGQREGFLHGVFEAAAVGLQVTDSLGCMVESNAAFQRMLGVDHDAIPGCGLETYMDAQDMAAFMRSSRALVESVTTSFRMQCRYRTASGATVWGRISASSMSDRHSGQRYVVAVVEDVTELKRAEDALHETEQLFEVLVAGIEDYAIYVLDPEGRVLTWNAGAQKIKGYRADEIVGRHFSRFYVADDIHAGKPAMNLETARVEGHFVEETLRLRKDGSSFWANVVISPLQERAGGLHGFIKITRDISARRATEAALRVSRLQLEARVLERTAALSDANDRLQREIEARSGAQQALAAQAEDLRRSNADLEKFAYVASHDLREPLRIVSSFATLLGRRYRDSLDREAWEFIDLIVDAATRMQRLVDDVLLFARVGSRGIDLRPTDVAGVVDTAKANLGVMIEESEASIVQDALPTVAADAGQLEQLFQNLLGNAIKFRSASVPRIRVSAEQKADVWHFCVADNGIGIAPRHHGRVFEIFQRLHGPAEYKGTGIGLAICKKIVERHHGRIWIESSEGNGARFCFTLQPDLHSLEADAA